MSLVVKRGMADSQKGSSGKKRTLSESTNFKLEAQPQFNGTQVNPVLQAAAGQNAFDLNFGQTSQPTYYNQLQMLRQLQNAQLQMLGKPMPSAGVPNLPTTSSASSSQPSVAPFAQAPQLPKATDKGPPNKKKKTRKKAAASNGKPQQSESSSSSQSSLPKSRVASTEGKVVPPAGEEEGRRERKNEREKQRRLQITIQFQNLVEILELPDDCNSDKVTILTKAVETIKELKATVARNKSNNLPPQFPLNYFFQPGVGTVSLPKT